MLEFWFALESPGTQDDERVRAALGPLHERAARGELDSWAEAPRSRLALILLLDQVPRHLFRDDPRTYATDARAAALTARFLELGDWEVLSPLEQFYVCSPWLHAEDAARQERINPHYHRLAPQLPGLEFMAGIADLYLETVRRFGRFPHRNPLLGRRTTPEEQRFLDEEWHPRRRRPKPDSP